MRFLERGYIDTSVEVDVDIDSYFGCFRGGLKSVCVLFNGIEAVMVLTLIVLKKWAQSLDPLLSGKTLATVPSFLAACYSNC